ncbi:RIP metalloprotease RseP [Oscillatoriales cyanobacterium LEGE 11467]|uniref:Zinc metalloprotease n=1 Tax=Zarconia navalis LEGE 11467 TaxID=1828826 RepID=A0A928W1V7_9CYAN|nr:RIP metalloprotease RseP [Zarconia navalis]MBE9041735.1 RIP metalloprotease RseP [Zarconia navalis LEGE 11467]
MSVLAAIAVILLLIVVHELGHFLAARLQGIHVNRFSIGFGPILWRYQGSKTEYAVRALPLGGFVGFPDDDPDSNIPEDDPDLLRNRPILDRALVISAGVIANLIFAYLILVLQVGGTGILNGFNYEPGILVPQVISADSPAARAGIRSGDIILSVGGKTLNASEESLSQFKEIIQSSPEQPLSMSIDRNGRQETVEVKPQPDSNGQGRIGVQLAPNGDPIYRRPHSIFEVLGLGAERFQTIFVGTAQGFYQLITDFGDTASQLASPVKIVQQGSEVAKADALNLLLFGAIISINLAIINILPLPALDGGQLFFLLVEGLRGKPVPVHIQDGFMQSGMLVLLGLGVFLIVRDTTQLEWVQELMR